MSFQAEEDRLRAISDPARRALAAAEAAQDAARTFRAIELTAMRELVDAHGGTSKHGAVAAAARELGRGPEAVRKRLTGNDSAEETEAIEPTGEPGRFFQSPYDAEDALRDWALQRQDVTLRRDPAVRGALAAGVSPRIVRDLTGVSLDTLDRLESTSPGTAVDVPYDVWEQAITYFTDLAARTSRQYSIIPRSAATGLAGVLGVPLGGTESPTQSLNALKGPDFDALSANEKADRIMAAPDDGSHVPDADHDDLLAGPDGWAAFFCAQMEEAAGSQDPDMAAITRRIAADLRHIRLTATLPNTQDKETHSG
ncbi:hypothetical protein ACFUJY_29790 [Streptomyces sp. NPDC057249]|uniref:hypothetical protein n=1 Tax=Streptomyces sp. NPDC057249 TaxID=3346067 RepID=UPI00362C41A0